MAQSKAEERRKARARIAADGDRELRVERVPIEIHDELKDDVVKKVARYKKNRDKDKK